MREACPAGYTEIKIAAPSVQPRQPHAPARRIRSRRFHLRVEDGRIPRTRLSTPSAASQSAWAATPARHSLSPRSIRSAFPSGLGFLCGRALGFWLRRLGRRCILLRFSLGVHCVSPDRVAVVTIHHSGREKQQAKSAVIRPARRLRRGEDEELAGWFPFL